MVSRFLVIWFFLFCPLLWAADSGGLKDPLQPLNYQSPVTPASPEMSVKKRTVWRLGAILIAAEREVAMINGQSLQIGDMLDGYRLVKIESASVLLQKKNEKIVLRRSGTGLKKAFLSRDVGKGSQP